MEGETLIVTAKVIAHAFDSKNAIQYFPGDVVQLDLANRDQRKLVWLRTPRGKWIFEFDRANSNSTALRMFFCKDCGQPFDKLTDLGTHSREHHNNTKIIVGKSEAIEADKEEARLLAEAEKREHAISVEPQTATVGRV